MLNGAKSGEELRDGAVGVSAVAATVAVDEDDIGRGFVDLDGNGGGDGEERVHDDLCG